MADLHAKSPHIVGQFIRNRRESVGLSQRALGQLFEPPVTTQFISNIERGVTPLPPVHIATLTRALKITEEELLILLEKEYAAKISNRVGRPELAAQMQGRSEGHTQSGMPTLSISASHYEFFSKLYEAFRSADPKTQDTFKGVCETLLHLSKK